MAGRPVTRAHALELDRADPLAAFRDRFEFGDGDRIYVDGNSLGRLSTDARAALEAAVEEWGSRLIGGWHDWIDLPAGVGDLLGTAALGAAPGQVVACDSTTVNLYKLAGAALGARAGAVVADAADFPTDRYALVVLSHVNYRSGALADMHAITRAAQAAGAFVLWDLCHSAGAVEVALDAAGADLAVGCSYKYLNAGPGAPAFLYVARRHHALRSPIQGWFSQADQFAMGPRYRPVAGIGRFLAGTPPVAGLVAVRAAAAMLEDAGIASVRRKAADLTALAVDLHDRRLAPLGFSLGTPRDPAARGAHVSLRHPDAWRVCRALIEHANVVPDFRRPDTIRFGLPPLYTRFVDVWDAIERLAGLVSEGVHERMPAEPTRLT